ncbi:MAG: hypothetical protein M1837_006564 [Sclerophora amabilis]|nr:MAG: hypothetical protein M1837_006564 [Sclerophora amabilis]
MRSSCLFFIACLLLQHCFFCPDSGVAARTTWNERRRETYQGPYWEEDGQADLTGDAEFYTAVEIEDEATALAVAHLVHAYFNVDDATRDSNFVDEEFEEYDVYSGRTLRVYVYYQSDQDPITVLPRTMMMSNQVEVADFFSDEIIDEWEDSRQATLDLGDGDIFTVGYMVYDNGC